MDSGYKVLNCITPDNVQCPNLNIHARICGLHETCSEQFKRFGVRHQDFRHIVKLNGVVFHADSNIAALETIYNELFQNCQRLLLWILISFRRSRVAHTDYDAILRHSLYVTMGRTAMLFTFPILKIF